ncbi:MAG: hypothetical protein ACOYJU_06155 [Anaerovoracaceae bacterium]|jgi:hypothetical protein
MKKTKEIFIVLILVLAFGFSACGGKEYVTDADYKKLADMEWSKMTIDEMNKEIGMDGVLDKERTKSWGKGYEVYTWPGKDGKGYLVVLFSDKEGDGKLTPSSMSSSLPTEKEE